MMRGSNSRKGINSSKEAKTSANLRICDFFCGWQSLVGVQPANDGPVRRERAEQKTVANGHTCGQKK